MRYSAYQLAICLLLLITSALGSCRNKITAKLTYKRPTLTSHHQQVTTPFTFFKEVSELETTLHTLQLELKKFEKKENGSYADLTKTPSITDLTTQEEALKIAHHIDRLADRSYFTSNGHGCRTYSIPTNFTN